MVRRELDVGGGLRPRGCQDGHVGAAPALGERREETRADDRGGAAIASASSGRAGENLVNRPLKGLLVGVYLGMAAALFAATPFGVTVEESVGLSALFKIRGPAEPPPGVVVVAIDRRSADEFGLPLDPGDWPRNLHGTLIDRLIDARASLIVFDLAFIRSRSIEEDLAFAQAISRSGRVILFASMRREQQPTIGRGHPGDGELWRERMQMPPPHLAGPALAVAPFPLPKVSASVHQFWGFSPDADGTPTLPAVALQALEVETWLQVVQEAGLLVVGPSLLDETYAAVANDLDEVPRLLRRTFKDLPRLEGEVRRVIDERRQAGLSRDRDWQLLNALADLYGGPDSHYLNFYGPPGTIRTIPYHEMIRGKSNARWADESALASAVVFVGSSESYLSGKGDTFPTAFTRDGVDLSGVEIAATAFANLLTRSVLRPLEPLTTTLVLVAFGAFVGGISCLLPATIAVPLAVALSAGYAIGAQVLFSAAGVLGASRDPSPWRATARSPHWHAPSVCLDQPSARSHAARPRWLRATARSARTGGSASAPARGE